MPSFGFSSPTFASPPPAAHAGIEESLSTSMSRSMSQSTTSVKLTCLSPNGSSIHCFSMKGSEAYIETYSLPLEGSVENLDRDFEDPTPAVIRTPLPDYVSSAMRRYPALELLCVDSDSQSSRSGLASSGRLHKLPRLCLYSKRDVFLLELIYTSERGAREVEGAVVSVMDPFDQVLLGASTSISIIRIRQAPQQYQGYSVLCPPQAMAMLAYDRQINRYSLHLHHSKEFPLTTPFSYGMEDLEEQLEQITDFCFCRSGAFPLLSNLSVAFLKASGDVLQASPVLFRGTVVPRDTISKTLDYISAQQQKYAVTTPKGRQLRAAERYILDCFPDGNARGPFVTAREKSAAFSWMAQMQGPVLFPPESDEFGTLATAIEPLSVDEFSGFAIGHVGYRLEFAMLAPTIYVPRFQHEASEDTPLLDNTLKWGTTVSRIDLREEENESEMTCETVALIRDPIMDKVVHYVTPNGVQSISTNALKVEANNVTQENPSTSSNALFSPPSKKAGIVPKTTGWTCLEVPHDPTSPHVVGVVVSGDVQFGHVLIARLSDGTMCPMNLTETRQLHEMEAINETEQLAIEAESNSAVTQELTILSEHPPLIDSARPLIEKVIDGLQGMGKVVGSATSPYDITPEILAASLDVKEQCDKSVILPLVELNEHVNIRRRIIASMFNDQVKHIRELKENLQKLKLGQASIKEKVEIVTANAESLAARSSSVLQSAGDLMPTITQSEHDYFRELQRLDEKTRQWEATLERVRLRSFKLTDSVRDGTAGGHLSLPTESRAQVKTLVKDVDPKMRQYKDKIEELTFRVDELAAVAGIEYDPDGEVGRLR